MKGLPKSQLRARDGDPGPLAWMIAALSTVLPVAGLLLCLFGGGQIAREVAGGWLLVGAGLGAFALDILIDYVWSHPRISQSDLPDLNRRGAQLAGRTAFLAEAIDGGRGKVRIGDTMWPAEGPDLPAGAAVRIVAASSTVLLVEAAPERWP